MVIWGMVCYCLTHITSLMVEVHSGLCLSDTNFWLSEVVHSETIPRRRCDVLWDTDGAFVSAQEMDK